MTTPGVVKVHCPPDILMAASTWLLCEYQPGPGTLLDDDLYSARMLTHAWVIGRAIKKQTERKRKVIDGVIKLSISRADAEWLRGNLPRFAIRKHTSAYRAATILRNILVRLRGRGRPRYGNRDINRCIAQQWALVSDPPNQKRQLRRWRSQKRLVKIERQKALAGSRRIFHRRSAPGPTILGV